MPALMAFEDVLNQGIVYKYDEDFEFKFVYDDETIKQNEERIAQQQHGDPRVQVATIKAEADAKIEEARQKFESDQNDRDRQNKIAVEMINERIASTELSSVERQVLEKLKVQLTLSAIDTRTEKDLALAGHKVDIHKHRNPAPVIKPPTEPPGRAQRGKAYQQ